MVNYQASLPPAFAALGDPVRWSIVDRLARGEASVSSLATGQGMSLPAFLKHVRVLEASGLLVTEKRGRVRTCRLLTAPLAQAETWLSEHRAFWTRQLDSLEHFLTVTPDEETHELT